MNKLFLTLCMLIMIAIATQGCTGCGSSIANAPAQTSSDSTAVGSTANVTVSVPDSTGK